MKTDIQQWAFKIIDCSYSEFGNLITRVPLNQREKVGRLKDWSPKDQVSHLTYWIELFVANLEACRKGYPLTDTTNYLAINEVAWQMRKDWAWSKIEATVKKTFSDVKAQIKDLNTEDLIDASRFTLEIDQKVPKPLIRSLIYELMDHPIHHFAGMYQKFGDKEGMNSLLTNTLQVMSQQGVSKWSTPTRNKIRALLN